MDLSKIATFFGKEDPIRISNEDPRYIYYTWLTKYFNVPIYKRHTNKCPLYQFMIWSSVLLVVLSPILLLGKIALSIFGTVLYKMLEFRGMQEFKKEASTFKGHLIGAGLTALLVGIVVFSVYDLNIANLGLMVVVSLALPAFILMLLWKFIITIPSILAWIVAIPFWNTILFYFLIIVGSILFVELVLYIALRVFKLDIISNTIKYYRNTSAKKRERKREKRKKEGELKIPPIRISPKGPPKIIEGLEDISRFINKMLSPLYKLTSIIRMLWRIISEVVGNHCPPVEFVIQQTFDIHYTGMPIYLKLEYYNSGRRIEFDSDDEKELEKYRNKKVTITIEFTSGNSADFKLIKISERRS